MTVPLQDMTFEEQLSTLLLPPLSHRRLRGDLIMLHKILNNYILLIYIYILPYHLLASLIQAVALPMFDNTNTKT